MSTDDNTKNIDLLLTKLHQELRVNPYNSDLYNNLGRIYYRINKLEDAIYNYKKALYLSPNTNNWQIHHSLANCYVKQNIIPEALSHYKAAIKLNPENIDTMQNLGILLMDTEDYLEALPYLEKSYIVNTDNQYNVEFIEQLANCHLQLGHITEAIEYLSKVINMDQKRETAHHNLAVLYLREKNIEKAKKHFLNALDLNPNNKTAKHMMASLNQENISQAPAEYISELFDQYATYYNKHVRDILQYKLPELFRNLYAKHNTTVTAKNALDLGCGTGLCGLFFRDATINLIGIDLSKKMLLQAQRTGFYDLLIFANLQHTIPLKPNYFDLVIAADVLPYIGDLKNIFYSVKNILCNTKNNFLFNIELNCNQDLNFLLEKTGRYTHSSNYIKFLAEEFNFKIIESFTETIRLQDDKNVIGVIFLLQSID